MPSRFCNGLFFLNLALAPISRGGKYRSGSVPQLVFLCSPTPRKRLLFRLCLIRENGLNSQLAIGLRGSQRRSNLNSKYLSGKCPDSFIWVYCDLYAYYAGFVAELTLLERLVAWDLKVEWEHLFQTILKWFRRKNNLRGLRTTPKGRQRNKLILLENIFKCGAFHTPENRKYSLR